MFLDLTVYAILIKLQMKNILHEEAIFLNHESYQLITLLDAFVGFNSI